MGEWHDDGRTKPVHARRGSVVNGQKQLQLEKKCPIESV
nr:hypothetical protein BN993_06624 [Virgibacillus halodenitrificans]